MITPTKLAGISLASIGIAGGSAGTIYAFWPETISVEKKLIEENKKILGEGSQILWEIKLATYNRIKGTNEEIKLTENTWGNLKSWCTQQTKAPFDEKKQKLYEGIKEVCTVPSHKEKLLSASKTLSDTDDWTKKAQTYPEGDNKPIPTITKGNNTAKELETWCNDKFGKEYKNDIENNNDLVVKWCTKETS